MAYRNKVYVAFDGDEDIVNYQLLKAWAANSHVDFDLNDAHEINQSYDDSEELSIKKQLRERFANSKLFVILIGEHTKYLRKFVRWEIETAIRLEIPIIAVSLNNYKYEDPLMPKLLNDNLSIIVPFKQKAIRYAMENWPGSDADHRKNNEAGQYHYKDSVYQRLGL